MADVETGSAGCACKQSFGGLCNELRSTIKSIGDRVLLLREGVNDKGQGYVGQNEEIQANVMLTYRHLEDARMRIGKILQAAGDGISILDKPDRPVGE